MSSEAKSRIFGLDLLRCMAILFVVYSHTSYMLPMSPDTKYISLMYFGYAGVEIFFVLSGYLVGKILLELLAKRPFTFKTIKDFWVRRWFRTLPAYYLALLIYASLDYYFYPQPFFGEPYKLLYIVFLQNFFTEIHEFFRSSWTLSVEEWFYLCLPLWMIFFYRSIKGRNFILYSIVTGILAITLLRIGVVYKNDPPWNLGVRTIVPLRLDSLLTGVLMAYLSIHYNNAWRKYAKLSFAAGLLLTVLISVWVCTTVFDIPIRAGFFSKTLFFNVFSIGIALCLPYMASVKTARFKPVGIMVTHISLVSYSLYLLLDVIIHVFIPVAYYKLSVPRSIYGEFIGSWIACIAAATIMYRFYEKPFTNLRERFRSEKELEIRNKK